MQSHKPPENPKSNRTGFSFAHESSLNDASAITVLSDYNKFRTKDKRPAVDTSAVLPNRLGVQGYIAQAAEGSSTPIDRDVQAAGFSFAHEGSLDDASVTNVLLDNNKFRTKDNRPSVDTSAVLPKRFGVQGYIGQAAEGSSTPTDRDVQASSKSCKSLNDVPVRLWRDLHVSSAYGQTPGMPVPLRANYGGPLRAKGPPPTCAPIQNGRPMSTNGQVLPVAKVSEDFQNCEVSNRPSLKRAAIQSSPDATWVHHRKLTRTPTIPPHMLYKPIPPSMPYKAASLSMSCKPVHPPASFKPEKSPAMVHTKTTAHPSMSALPHIKWQGINEQPEPTGDKCLICRRDLIFSPEGPVERPPTSPPIAVLRCGHTFHDHCLQKITPEDQSKSPPCIPCAIGEN